MKYSTSPEKNYETNKIIYNHIDEIWSFDLADMIDYKISNKGFRYIFVVIDNFYRYTWCIPLKTKYGETIAQDFSIFLTKSKRSRLKIESDRGKEWYNSFFQIFSKVKNFHPYSRFSDKGPPICERGIRTIRNLIVKTNMFSKKC